MLQQVLAFAGEHPWLAFFGGMALVRIVLAPVHVVYRVVRHMNIRARGWPPAHLDADGDWKPEAEE